MEAEKGVLVGETATVIIILLYGEIATSSNEKRAQVFCMTLEPAADKLPGLRYAGEAGAWRGK